MMKLNIINEEVKIHKKHRIKTRSKLEWDEVGVFIIRALSD